MDGNEVQTSGTIVFALAIERQTKRFTISNSVMDKGDLMLLHQALRQIEDLVLKDLMKQEDPGSKTEE